MIATSARIHWARGRFDYKSTANMTTITRLFLAALLCSAPVLASAQVFRCADSAGKLQFSDLPCAADQKSSEVRIDKHPEPVQPVAAPAQRMAPEAAAYLKDRERRIKEHAAANPGAVKPTAKAQEMRGENYNMHKCIEARRAVAMDKLYTGVGQDTREWSRRAEFYCGQ